jgi:hypothetical protein
MTGRPLASALAPVGIVRIRQSQSLVKDLQPPLESGEATLVSMSCLGDDAQDDAVGVNDIDSEVVRASWDRVGRRHFDATSRFVPCFQALRWECVAATNTRLFQLPRRTGIEVMDYQLEPDRTALRLPRVTLFIADEVGLRKSFDSGLVLRAMLLLQRVLRPVVAVPLVLVFQGKGESGAATWASRPARVRRALPRRTSRGESTGATAMDLRAYLQLARHRQWRQQR